VSVIHMLETSTGVILADKSSDQRTLWGGGGGC